MQGTNQIKSIIIYIINKQKNLLTITKRESEKIKRWMWIKIFDSAK
jgi:hypothetical protein